MKRKACDPCLVFAIVVGLGLIVLAYAWGFGVL